MRLWIYETTTLWTLYQECKRVYEQNIRRTDSNSQDVAQQVSLEMTAIIGEINVRMRGMG